MGYRDRRLSVGRGVRDAARLTCKGRASYGEASGIVPRLRGSYRAWGRARRFRARGFTACNVCADKSISKADLLGGLGAQGLKYTSDHDIT
jgi:hypothetical protein